jgi:hypothetical protein
MKVSELKRLLSHSRYPDEEDVMVVVSGQGAVGGTPKVPIKSAGYGIDWDSGKFMLYPDTPVKRTNADEIKAASKALEEAGWSLYEMRNLKAEVKRLKAKLATYEDSRLT